MGVEYYCVRLKKARKCKYKGGVRVILASTNNVQTIGESVNYFLQYPQDPFERNYFWIAIKSGQIERPSFGRFTFCLGRLTEKSVRAKQNRAELQKLLFMP